MVTTLPITQSDVLNAPRGMDLLDTPTLNKGTAFTEAERTELGLQGLLPPHVETLDEQAVRAYEAFQKKDSDRSVSAAPLASSRTGSASRSTSTIH